MAITRVNVKPELLRWACERSSGLEDLRGKVPHLSEWIDGKKQPTLKQLSDFANAARVSVGYLFLSNPPVEQIPIPDLRTVAGQGVRKPSPDMLDIIYMCQRRQEWYRDYVEHHGDSLKDIHGTATIATSPSDVALSMQQALEFSVEDRQDAQSPDAALRMFIDRTERMGVLVMVCSTVGTNTNRKLDPKEFRGFALADPLAPLIFVNGADGKAAQMFTLAHELAHLWLGGSALSDASLRGSSTNQIEQWCNRVAAEFLVPIASLEAMGYHDPLSHLVDYQSRFKVSRLVILRRLLDADMISRPDFDAAYAVASQVVKPAEKKKNSGPTFYTTFPRTASKRFIKALYSDTIEGSTMFREACGLLGISSADTFRKLGKQVSES